MQRRLLILTFHFPPSRAVAVFRMLGFAQHLPRCGWQVGVLAPPDLPWEPLDDALRGRVPPETAQFSVPYPRGLLARTAHRFCGDGVWVPRALAAVARAMRTFRPTAVLTSGPPQFIHMLGLMVKRRWQLPWLADFRDPWYTNGRPRKGMWAALEGFWEKRVFRHADSIVANAPNACTILQDAYPELRHKMSYLTNGFDPEAFPPPRPLVPLNDRLTILHAGEIYAGRDPRPLLDALKALERTRTASEGPVRFRLLGQALDNRSELQSAVCERGLEHVVEMGGQVPYAEALEAMTSADVLLLMDNLGRKIGLPAKLYEYLGAGRPVLALAEHDGDTAWALRASGTPHRIAPVCDAAAIEKALIDLRDGLRQQRFAPPSADQLAMFTRARLAQQLAERLDTILPKTDHAPERFAAAPPAHSPHYARA
jgi:glycosyltransferase involved in cell wall biosynthesis